MRECGGKMCRAADRIRSEGISVRQLCRKPKWGDPVLFFVFFDYLRVAWGDGIFQNDFPDRVGSDPAGRGIFH